MQFILSIVSGVIVSVIVQAVSGEPAAAATAGGCTCVAGVTAGKLS